MIWTRSIFYLLALSTFFLLSCNSDNDDNGDAATCEDGIQNQGEHDVDCGGPCPPCAIYGMKARISGFSWVAKNIAASYSGGKLTIEADNGSVPLWFITIVHDGPTEPGSYTMCDGGLQQMAQPYDFKSGSITITEWDKSNKTVSGTFRMTCAESYDVKVEDGTFTDIHYE